MRTDLVSGGGLSCGGQGVGSRGRGRLEDAGLTASQKSATKFLQKKLYYNQSHPRITVIFIKRETITGTELTTQVSASR